MKVLYLLVLLVLVPLYAESEYIVRHSCISDSKVIFVANVCFFGRMYFCEDGIPLLDDGCYQDSNGEELNTDCNNNDFYYECTNDIDSLIKPEEYCIVRRYNGECEELAQIQIFKTGVCVQGEEQSDANVYIKQSNNLYKFHFGDNQCSSGYYESSYSIGDVCHENPLDGYLKVECEIEDDKLFRHLITSQYSCENEECEHIMDEVMTRNIICTDERPYIQYFYKNFISTYYYDSSCEESYYIMRPYKKLGIDDSEENEIPTNIITNNRNTVLVEMYFEDTCTEDFKPAHIRYIFTDKSPCPQYQSFYVVPVDNTSYKLFVYTDETCDSFIEYEEEYGKCVYDIDNSYKAYKLDIPPILELLECDSEGCSINKEIKFYETLEVDIILIIKEESMINLDLLSLSKGIIVKDNGAVHINGGTIVIDIDSLEKWELLKEKFDDNNVFEFIIIDGFYTGQFNDILIRVMINNGDDNNAHAFELIKVGECEKIDAELNYKERSLSAIFTLDESECGDSNGSKGVKWWLIVIITCSILIVLLIIFILLVTFNEKVRSHVLPYH